MKISKQELLSEALETGFRPEIMEKVWHLMAVLDGISVHPFLKERLVLKGGTALNLFFFDLPRLSVSNNGLLSRFSERPFESLRNVVQKSCTSL
jgi:predicted nucleotidyltransferase component of viral defense system